MLKIISIVFILLTLLSGCVSQNSQSFGQNFDKLDAAKTRVSLGLTYLRSGNFSQAKFNLDKALEFAPRSADANFAMAYYYQSVDELEQAEEAYQFAMDLEPKNANIANSYGAFLCQNGDYENAKKYFLKAVNTSSYISSAETYENLALCSQSQGRPEDAIQYLRSAVNHQPGRANSLFLLTRSLVDTQQWQEARAILRRYEKTSQVSPQSLLMAMKIEVGLGNDTAAKGYSDMLIRIFPNDPVTKSLLAELQSVTETTKQTPLVPVAKKVEKIITEVVEAQPTEKPTSHSVTQPEQQDLFADQKEHELDTDPIELKLAETLPSKSSSDSSVMLAETNDSVVSVNQYQIDSGNVAQDNVAGADILEDQPTEMESDVPDKPTFHIVSKGENLYRISLLYNIKMQRLIDWNGLADASAIFDGKKLTLVAPSVVE